MRHIALPSLLTFACLAMPAHAQTAAAQPAAPASACANLDPAHQTAAQVRDALTCTTAEAASGLNAGLPRQVDPQTTLQRVDAQGTILTYNYNVSVLRSEVSAAAIQGITTHTRTGICANPNMQTIIGFGGGYRYRWYDRNGELIAEVMVSSC